MIYNISLFIYSDILFCSNSRTSKQLSHFNLYFDITVLTVTGKAKQVRLKGKDTEITHHCFSST